MSKTYIYISIFILIVAGAIIWASGSMTPTQTPSPAPSPTPTGVVCTMEAKQCSDGSYVARTGPNCEFAQCPNSQIKQETTASLNQKILNGGVYITPLQVTSDSRCAPGVQCIWAGEILIKVKLEKGAVSKDVDIKEGGSVTFEGSTITLTSVIPENKTNPPTPQKDYQFVFKVVSAASPGTISGTVTLSPTCPVERIPPDPSCAPKPYATAIDIMASGSTKILKTIQSDASGAFKVNLTPGSYVLQAHGGNTLPRCLAVSVVVKSNQYNNTNISCDTGIR